MALFCEALRAAAVACFPGDMGGGLPGVRVRAARSGEFALPELLPELFRIVARICVARIDARIMPEYCPNIARILPEYCPN